MTSPAISGRVPGAERQVVDEVAAGAHVAGDGLLVALGQLGAGAALGLALEYGLQLGLLHIGGCPLVRCPSASPLAAIVEQIGQLPVQGKCALASGGTS